MKICFSLGSNLGDRLRNLRTAVEYLKKLGEVVKKSDIFETEPWGGIEQPDFLNACVMLEMKYKEPMEILKIIKNFEIEIGRVKTVRWGTRKIDIDILLIDNLIFDNTELKIPHKNLHERLFVLVPLEQIFPEWHHPELNISIEEMLRKISGSQREPLRITKL